MGDEEDKKKNSEASGADSGEVKELKEKLEKCEKEKAEYLAGWQRAKADFINYKKEEMQRLEDIARYGSVELIRDLIAIIDNFDLGLRAMEKSGSVDKGIYMIRTQIEDILRKRGVERIEVKVGDKFDPSSAEAVAAAESDKPEGTVLEEIEPGYRIYDKILRPARVKVSKGNVQEIEEFCKSHNLVIKRTTPYPLWTNDKSILSVPLELSVSDSFEKIKNVFDAAQFKDWRVVGFSEHNEVGPSIQFKRK